MRGRFVRSAELLRRDILIAPGDPPGGVSRQRSGRRHIFSPIAEEDLLVGEVVDDILRRGKQLAIIARSGRCLVVQLGMSGTMNLIAARGTLDRHTHAIWSLDSGVCFCFRDPRRFGALRVFRSCDALEAHWAALGPDALTISGRALHDALTGSNRPIKAALLDQQVLAGVGNIYADESLHIARINPRFRGRRLSLLQADALAEAIRTVLSQAIAAGGSTLRDYTDADGRAGSYQSRHAVYGRAGLPCPTCSLVLSTALLAQRTTVWCSGCQPLRR